MQWKRNAPVEMFEISCPYAGKSGYYSNRETALNSIFLRANDYDPFYIAMGMQETFIITHKPGKDGIKERLTPSEIAYISKGLKRYG